MELLNRITAPSIVVISFMFRSIIRLLRSLTAYVGYMGLFTQSHLLFAQSQDSSEYGAPQLRTVIVGELISQKLQINDEILGKLYQGTEAFCRDL